MTVAPSEDGSIASVPEKGDGIPTAAIVGLLALLGIGGAGIAAMRSRRRRAPVMRAAPTTMPAPNVDRAPATATPAFAPATASVAKPTTSTFERVRYPASSSTITDPRPVAATAAASSSDTLVLDREEPSARARRPIASRDLDGPLPTGEAREQLLRDMVAAEPDESNPFRSPKSRRRRARVILQHREFLQRQGSDARFDWRTYRPTIKPSTTSINPSMVPA